MNLTVKELSRVLKDSFSGLFPVPQNDKTALYRQNDKPEILRRLRLLEDDKMAQHCHAEQKDDKLAFLVILNTSTSLSTGSVKTWCFTQAFVPRRGNPAFLFYRLMQRSLFRGGGGGGGYFAPLRFV